MPLVFATHLNLRLPIIPLLTAAVWVRREQRPPIPRRLRRLRQRRHLIARIQLAPEIKVSATPEEPAAYRFGHKAVAVGRRRLIKTSSTLRQVIMERGAAH